MDNESVTVSQINKYINSKMRTDDTLSDINIRGEISNFKTYPSGHSYFKLKDSSSQLNCVMFRGYGQYLKIKPKDGMKVIVRGNIEVYEKNGIYQLYAHEIKEDGIGELYEAFEKLKKKLDNEGLFDEIHKKEIPKYPKRIGVVTASNGAAVRDIITTIKRRYPPCEILVFSSLVQGDFAKYQLVNQIANAEKYDLDILIVGRGGGSIEDLWPFNEESVARKIYECNIPVISAVGHEIDYTIADYVADLRAPTPTAAAELAVPDMNELKYKLDSYNQRINNCIEDMLVDYRVRLNQIARKKFFKNPAVIYDNKAMQLDTIIGRFRLVSSGIINDNRNKLFKLENSIVLKKPDEIIKNKKDGYLRLVGKLEVLNPLITLKRGYCISKCEDNIISSAEDVKCGDKLDVEFDDGIVHTKVI